jgi:hypothetical protein
MSIDDQAISRRALLRNTACGFGAVGLSALLAEESRAAEASVPENPLRVKEPHFPARAKRVIFLYMSGGPSHIDIFDPKPRLERENGKPVPFQRGLTFNPNRVDGLLKSPWSFKQHGQSGIWISELFPHLAGAADDLCILQSMVGDGVDHGAAVLQMHTGVFSFTRPGVGAWVIYGLGSENQNLPGFITIKPTYAFGGAKNWSSSFLPGAYQGTPIGNDKMDVNELSAQPIEHLLPKGVTSEQQRYELEMLRKMNRQHAAQRTYNPALEARIQAFQLAARMQSEGREAFDPGGESAATRKLYGLDDETTRDFGWQCLLARRLAERGVRFVQCTSAPQMNGPLVFWDQHSDLARLHARNARMVDKPIAGLLKDLKARGLLKDTLVLWGGEFGRTPWAQGDGRDHNPYGFTMWMAGGGVKPGFVYGATDEYGYHSVEDRMHIHDLHATLLHLMGVDHEKLTYRFGGRYFRLTDVEGVVASKIVA